MTETQAVILIGAGLSLLLIETALLIRYTYLLRRTHDQRSEQVDKTQA